MFTRITITHLLLLAALCTGASPALGQNGLDIDVADAQIRLRQIKQQAADTLAECANLERQHSEELAELAETERTIKALRNAIQTARARGDAMARTFAEDGLREAEQHKQSLLERVAPVLACRENLRLIKQRVVRGEEYLKALTKALDKLAEAQLALLNQQDPLRRQTLEREIARLEEVVTDLRRQNDW